MSRFTELAQQSYTHYTKEPSPTEWTLKETLAFIMPFLQEHGGDLDVMPGLRQAFGAASPQELQAMWTEYCHLGDLLYAVERELHQ